MFRTRGGTKLYRVITDGTLPEEGKVEGVLIRDEEKNRYIMQEGSVQDAGYSLTRYRRLWYNGKVSCAEAELVTGRTHQIRSHLAAVGHPVIGDGRYGDPAVNMRWKKITGSRLMLHCHTIQLPPAVTEYMGPADGMIESPVPAVFDRFRKEI
jgi:23S rRNA pseudouridine955/2504/2580 synthase